jgi:NAD(P)-dependent dehydrogenase (short-subunit alcohol dehydrogenase family)
MTAQTDTANATASPRPGTGRIALVTGANRGLGRSTALRLAEDGVDLLITYRSHADEAQAVVDAATALGRTAHAFQLDTGRVEDFAPFADELRAVLKDSWDREDFDFLVNNAGGGLSSPFTETTVESFDELMNVHVRGVYFLTQTLAPLIADGGRIINLSSGLARFTTPGFSAYAAMKGAVEVLTRYLAKELGGRGITANIVAPGPVATDFGGGAVRDNAQMRGYLESQTALGRVGEAADIGGVISALLSERTGWINGQRIEASGGMLL